MKWFRLYAEAVDDAKLRLLAFEDRWHFVALLCCKASGILDGEDADLRRRKVAVKLGLDVRELGEVARRLAEVELIEEETLQPLAWNDRQFQSDDSAERVRAYRERMKRDRNVSVTAQDTDTDTDTERKKKAAPKGSRFALTHLPDEWKAFCKTTRADLNPEIVFDTFRDYWQAKPGKDGVKLDWFATWRNWVRGQRAAPGAKPESAAVRPWHETASGVEAKGRSLGLTPEQFCLPDGRQDWQAFAAAVKRKAGVHA